VHGVKWGVVYLVKLGVVSIKVMVKGKGGDESAEDVVYMRKSRGPRTDPWGRHRRRRRRARKCYYNLTCKERDDKYDLNQLTTEPWIPNQDERRVSKMLWSVVSKAAERLRRHRQDNCCDAIALIRSS